MYLGHSVVASWRENSSLSPILSVCQFLFITVSWLSSFARGRYERPLRAFRRRESQAQYGHCGRSDSHCCKERHNTRPIVSRLGQFFRIARRTHSWFLVSTDGSGFFVLISKDTDTIIGTLLVPSRTLARTMSLSQRRNLKRSIRS